MIKELLTKIRQFAREGLFHIFGSKVIAQVGGLISSAIVTHRLPKLDYGHYSSADNLYSYLAIFIGLGLTSAMIQYCSERVSEQRKNAIYRHSLYAGSAFNVLICIAVLVLAFWKERNGSPEVAYYLRLMCGLPFVVYADSYLQVVLRVKLKNRAFSYANMAYSVVLLIGNIVFSLLLGIPGLICSMYLAYLVAAAICGAALQKEGFFGQIAVKENRLSYRDKREITSYALICALTNFASTVLVLLDVTCLDLVLGDYTVLADYKVAAKIPAACTFIPSCLMTFFYPKLVGAFSISRKEGIAAVKQLAKVYAVVNGFAYVCLALFAPMIIWIVFGEKYMNVIPLFEILSLNYLIYCVRNLTGNVLAVMKKVKINLLFSVLSGVLNICLNMMLIPLIGSVGAALATLMVTMFISVMNAGYLWWMLKKTE